MNYVTKDSTEMCDLLAAKPSRKKMAVPMAGSTLLVDKKNKAINGEMTIKNDMRNE